MNAWQVQIDETKRWYPVLDVVDLGPGLGNSYFLEGHDPVHECDVIDLLIL